MNLAEAIASLDPSNNDHWTESGLPKLDVLKELTGESHSRKDVTEAAPLVTRERLLAEANTKVLDASADVSDNPEVKTLPEPKAEEAPAEDELAAAKAELEEAERVRHAAEVAFKAAKDALADATAKRDKISQRVDELAPKPSNQDEIMRWLASQKAQREARAARGGLSDLDQSLKNRPRPRRDKL